MKGQEDKSVDDCEVEEIMRNDLKLTNDFEDKWQFPKPRYYLATILDSGAVRPLVTDVKSTLSKKRVSWYSHALRRI